MMTRIDKLPKGTEFELPSTGLRGRLVEADTELGTGATVVIYRAREAKTIVNKWTGKEKTIPAGFNPESSWWSCGTMVEPLATSGPELSLDSVMTDAYEGWGVQRNTPRKCDCCGKPTESRFGDKLHAWDSGDDATGRRRRAAYYARLIAESKKAELSDSPTQMVLI